MKMQQSLKNVLTVNFMLVAAVPLLLLGFVALNMLDRSLTEDITSRNLLLAQSLVGEVHAFLDTPLATLGQLAEMLEQGNTMPEESLNTYLASETRHYGVLEMIRVLDRERKVTHVAPFHENYIGLDMSGHQFVQAAQTSGRPAWSSTFISAHTRQPTLTVGIPFTQGVLIGYVNLKTLNAVTDRVRIGAGGYAILIDHQGSIIAHPNKSLVSEQVNISYIPAIQKGLAGEEGTFTVSGPEGKAFSSVAIVPHTGWVVAIIQPMDDALQPVARIRNILWAGMLATLLLASLLALNLVRKTLRPLIGLTEWSQKIALGQYAPLTQQASYREVDDLAKSFTCMLEAIRDREESLKTSEGFLNSVIEQSPYAMWIADKHGTLLRLNNACRELLHITDDEVVGKYNVLNDNIVQEQGMLPQVKKVFEQSKPARFILEYDSTRLNQLTLHAATALILDVTIFPITDSQGRMTNAVIQHRDITEQRRAEHEVESLAKFPSENPSPVLRVDRKGSLLYANEAAFSVLSNWKLQIGQIVPDVLQELAHEKAEQRVRMKDIPHGKRIFSVVASDSPDAGYVTMYASDITDRKRAEEQLQRLNQELEQRIAERTRELQEAQGQLVRHEKLAVLGQMAGSVGHELRTPLSTISNAVYYLTMVLPDADENIIEYLDIIASETRNAEKIITDLLDFSRIKSLNRQEVQVADIVALMLEKQRTPSTVRITTEIPNSLPAIVADRAHLEQVLLNLISNAYQAMPQGGALTISTRLEDSMVAIDVHDTGEGIAPDHLDTIFEPLFTTKPKGIGLGLAVCKNLIEANDGKITVQSEQGAGTTFTVCLPVGAEESVL